jgi:hypothetical protein
LTMPVLAWSGALDGATVGRYGGRGNLKGPLGPGVKAKGWVRWVR